MKKLFTLFLTLIVSLGTIFASVTINGIVYNLNETDLSAEVTRSSSVGYSGSVVIPASVSYNNKTYSVTGIGSSAFEGCSGLTSVNIPNSVTSIGGYAFYYCSGLTSVNIPNSATSIGDYAFYYCSVLTSVTIPNSVTSIGESAFYECTGLTAVHISDIAAWCAIDFSGSYSNPLANAHNLYLNDELITNLVIPDGFTSIGNYAFNGCECLTSITIPNSVTSIGDYAFRECTGLTSVTIPNSVTSIGNNAFGYSGLTSIEIPNSVTSIGSGAFSSCSGLTSINIPNSVTSIGGGAFENCSSLNSVIAPASIFEVSHELYWANYTHSLESVTFNGGELTYSVLGILARSYKTLTTLDISSVSNTELDDEAFKGFYNLQNLQLPANLTRIGYMAVADCKNLQSINIPASVTEISQSAFENCRSLKTITFGGQTANAPGRLNAPATSTSQLQKIGNWAFYNCHELQNLTIPEGVTEIGDGAFYGCTYLEGLSLPASVQSIGDNTFALCAKLQKIVVNAPVPPSIQAKTFFDVQRQIPVYVPDESISAYKNDAMWGEFDIQGISNMPQGIDQISHQQNVNTQKLIKEGQILILSGDKTYTLTGQEVK